MPDPRDRRAWDSRVPPEEAASVLARAYAELAGEEALFRALLAERDLKREQAHFWIDVYARLSSLHQRASH